MIKRIIKGCKRFFKRTEVKKISEMKTDYLSTFIIDDVKCKECSELCVKACEEMGIGSISTTGKGVFKVLSTECIGCAVCAAVCPTNAISVVDKDGERKMWGKKFKLLKCEKCGKEFATEKHLKFVFSRSDFKMEEILCEKCRRKCNADKIKNAFGNVGL